MKKLLAAIAVAASLVLGIVTASPASAAHYNRVCKTFPGPDGAGGAQLRACIDIEDNFTHSKVRGYAQWENTGQGRAIVHFSYIQVVRDGLSAFKSGDGIFTVFSGSVESAVTPWLLAGNHSYHTRERMWVCWPDEPGDPCGSPVAWNSGEVDFD